MWEAIILIEKIQGEDDADDQPFDYGRRQITLLADSSGLPKRVGRPKKVGKASKILRTKFYDKIQKVQEKEKK